MPANPLNAKIRVDQLAVEVVGQYSGTGHLRVDQLAVEAVGAYKGSKVRVDQLGAEIVAQWKSASNVRIDQLGLEIVGKRVGIHPLTGSGSIRLDQLGIEIVRTFAEPNPAGDTTGYEYYVGPGFTAGVIPKHQPVSYEPQWSLVEALVALGNLAGITVSITANVATAVPLNGTSTINVTFAQPFNEACYFVALEYVPQNGDSTPIYIKGLPSNISPTGFTVTGLLVSGSTTNTTGTFSYVAVGL